MNSLKKNFVFVLLWIGQTGVAQEITTYYLIRHAEKVRTDPTDRNPHLTKAGKERAENWQKILVEVPFDMVLSTPYNRTIETAQPIATAKNLPITRYNPQTLFDAQFREQTKGKIVLVVGHSNTTPALANKILGKVKYPQIKDDTNGNLYILQITPNGVTSQLLLIE